MTLPVLLLLSLLPTPCGGCDFDLEGAKNMKATIDSNPTGFRSVFPKDYYIVHRYTKHMLCDTDPCCVFPAAFVLLDSWHVLLRNLWDEHLNHSLILDLKQTLDKIISKNRNMDSFREETDLSQFTQVSSSPEELLKLTSELFSRWIEVGCPASTEIETCTLPTLPPSVERKDYGPSRARLLTTRAIRKVDEEHPDKLIHNAQPLLTGVPPSYSVFIWTSLLFRLYWWLLP